MSQESSLSAVSSCSACFDPFDGNPSVSDARNKSWALLRLRPTPVTLEFDKEPDLGEAVPGAFDSRFQAQRGTKSHGGHCSAFPTAPAWNVRCPRLRKGFAEEIAKFHKTTSEQQSLAWHLAAFSLLPTWSFMGSSTWCYIYNM